MLPLLHFFRRLFFCAVVYRAARLLLALLRVAYTWHVKRLVRPSLVPDLAGYYAKRCTVITGATDGIGKAYALELARRGCANFCLVGRNSVKLCAVKQEIEDIRSDVDVTFIEFDLSRPDIDEAFPFSRLQELDIGIFVNCAGIAVDKLADWMDHPSGLAKRILQVNTVAPITLADAAMRSMEQRGTRGLVVNVASVLAWRPQLHTSAYSASKAALTFATHAMHYGAKKRDIRVQCLMPIVVATKMTKYDSSAANGFTVVSSDAYARAAVNILGMCMFSCGTPFMDVAIELLIALPDAIRSRLINMIFWKEKSRFNKSD